MSINIAGESNGGKLTRCSANADIEATGENTIAGGLAGVANSDISISYSEGSLTLTGAGSYAGGLLGQNLSNGTVANCYSRASASSTLYAAGLVAYNYGAVSNSYAKGNVSSQYYGAGVVGYNDGANATLSGCVSGSPKVDISDQKGWAIRVLGGFKNGAAQPGENNYALNTIVLSVNGVPKKVTDNILDGYAKTEEELEQQSTYTGLGWDFSDVWSIDEGHAWPLLNMKENGLIESIVVSPETVSLEVGETCQLTATVYPADATNKTLKWVSSDRNIAKVSNGLVTAVSEGTATITVLSTDGTGKSAQVVVTVTPTTGIHAIVEDSKNANTIYDLQGRRVYKPTRGVYIVNGKKILIK